jgi:pimeloyl-ACP methyl ester carboxylesterase
MRKTLLLVFIHGFKGGDDTFGKFPEHLRALISHALPKVDVLAVAYPRFETRGELKECVVRFREWLENKVIDIEVAHQTPSPTIDPSVHTILVGHSMGGIVAAETLLLLARDQPLPPQRPDGLNFASNTALHSTTGTSHPNPDPPSPTASGLMFPHIQGLLLFDTPFLGLNPSMVAHSLEGTGKMASSAYGALNEILPAFGWGSKSESALPATASKPIGALPAPGVDAAAAPKWQSWGKYAMFAGAAGAVAAGGAAALYSQKEKISAGWGWASSHLLFVGDLVKPEHLKKRVAEVEGECQARGLGCANLYTNLGAGAREGYGVTAAVAGKERTFCNLPVKVGDAKGEEQQGMRWLKALNEKAKDETSAHMSMFFPRDNPGFYGLGQTAKELVAQWVDQGWYDGSEERADQGPAGQTLGEVGEDWDKPDYDDEEVKAKMHEKRFSGDGTFEHPVEINDDDANDDVEMTDDIKENDDLESSIIVDTAQKSKILLQASGAREF